MGSSLLSSPLLPILPHPEACCGGGGFDLSKPNPKTLPACLPGMAIDSLTATDKEEAEAEAGAVQEFANSCKPSMMGNQVPWEGSV